MSVLFLGHVADARFYKFVYILCAHWEFVGFRLRPFNFLRYGLSGNHLNYLIVYIHSDGIILLHDCLPSTVLDILCDLACKVCCLIFLCDVFVYYQPYDTKRACHHYIK